jgi:DNA-binding NtrC family response regulator
VDQSRRCRLLAAVTPMGYEHVKRSVQDGFRLVPAFSMADAVAVVRRGDVDAVLCGINFEDSGMVDLLREVRKIRPDLPVVGCLMHATDLSLESVAKSVAAAQAQGAVGFIDYHGIRCQLGTKAADRQLRDELLRLLPKLSGA